MKKSDTNVFEEHLTELGTYNLYYAYLDLLRAFCGRLPEAKLELVVSDPFEKDGWSSRPLIESEVIDYQVRLWLRGNPTRFVVPLVWLEQISTRMGAAFEVKDSFVRHLTYLEKLDEIIQWVTLWEFCDHCSRAGADNDIQHEQFSVTYGDLPIQVRRVRVIRNSLGKEYWWLIMQGPQEDMSAQLHPTVPTGQGSTVAFDCALATVMRRTLTGFQITRIE